MTHQEAIAEARRRWGKHGNAWDNSGWFTSKIPPKRVGVWSNGCLRRFGAAYTWEAAFANAHDQRDSDGTTPASGTTPEAASEAAQ